MRDAGARRVKINTMFAGESLDLRVLGQIFRRSILDVMIDGEHRLGRIGDHSSADLLKLRDHRAGVIVGHHMTWTNRDEIATANRRARRESISMARRNLLNQRQTHISSGLPMNHTNHVKR